jgi:spore maturation protein A
VNAIWVFLITVSVSFAVFYGRLDAFTKALFDAAKSAVEVSLFLLGIVALWMGVTKIIEDSGLIHKLSGFFRPVIKRLFKNVPDDHPAITSITLNILANMFGLGNAATPLGIKAMQDLKALGNSGDSITFEMMLFVVLNTASLQIIPFTIIGILSSYGSADPNSIIVPILISSFAAAAFGVSLLFVFRRIFK